MANMTTTLQDFDVAPNSKTYRVSTHTAAKPRLVIQKRSFPAAASGVYRDTVQVVYGTVNADGLPLTNKIGFEVSVRRTGDAHADDLAAAKTMFREIVASDNFDVMIAGQAWLQ